MKTLKILLFLVISASTFANGTTIIRCDSCQTRSDFEDKAYEELKKNYNLSGTSYLFSYEGNDIDESFYIYSRKSSDLFALDPTCGPSMQGPNFSDCYFINDINSELGKLLKNIASKYYDIFICDDCSTTDDAAYLAFNRITGLDESNKATIGAYHNYGSWQPPREKNYLVLDIENGKSYSVNQLCVEIHPDNYYGFKSTCGFSQSEENTAQLLNLATSLKDLSDAGSNIYQVINEPDQSPYLVPRSISIDLPTKDVPESVFPSGWDLVGSNNGHNSIASWYNGQNSVLDQIFYAHNYFFYQAVGYIEDIRVPFEFSDGSTVWYLQSSSPSHGIADLPADASKDFLGGVDADLNTISNDISLYSTTTFNFTNGGWSTFLKFVDALSRLGLNIDTSQISKEDVESGEDIKVNINGNNAIIYKHTQASESLLENMNLNFDSGQIHTGHGGDQWNILYPSSLPPLFYLFPDFPQKPEFNVEVGPVTLYNPECVQMNINCSD